MHDSPRQTPWLRILVALGPAIIVASVVMGPGSILTNSKIGWQFGYRCVWVLAGACLLMAAFTAISARLGVVLSGSLCDELASRLGRPAAALVGICLFLVASSFQFSNNLGVLFALEPILESAPAEPESLAVAELPAAGPASGFAWWPMAVLLGLNAIVIAALFGLRQLYRPTEVLMKILVGIMMIGFAGNLLLARPSLSGVLVGLVPQLPQPLSSLRQTDWVLLLGLISTTFSVGGAFYQSYLVRQKGWTREDISTGLIDSVTGIAALGFMSLMVMVTAAAVLHGNSAVERLDSAADVAIQLRPLFRGWATYLFCAGIFAGALSSFLVNAMIGGTILSDGLGWGGRIEQWGPRVLTVAVLLIGMCVAIGVKLADFQTGNLIIFAQAITVLGNPLMAIAMLWLAYRGDVRSVNGVPRLLRWAGWVGVIVVCLLSLWMTVRLATSFLEG